MKHVQKLLPLVALLIISLAQASGQCTTPCSTYNQSPIDIVTATVRTCARNPLTAINFPATLSSFRVAHNTEKHNVTITPMGTSTNTVTFNGTLYTLEEIHAHAPAEHAIDSTRSAYELHFVFNRTSGPGSPKLVIAMWGSYMTAPVPTSYTDPVTTTLISSIAAVGKTSCTGGGPITIMASLNRYQTNGQLNNYYTYCGTLTTGTFDPGVTWVVCRNPVNAYVDRAINLLISDVCPNTIEGARRLQTRTHPVYSVMAK